MPAFGTGDQPRAIPGAPIKKRAADIFRPRFLNAASGGAQRIPNQKRTADMVKKSIRESWGVWDIVGTLVVVGLCATFYAYFW